MLGHFKLSLMSNQILDVPEKHPLSLSGLLDNAWSSLAEMTMKNGWAPLTKLAESLVVSYVVF